jgi:regulator of sigma E protease
VIDSLVQFVEVSIAFVAVLGPLVFVHELGHFLVAKAFGVEVPVFSLGFGPRLIGIRRGGTDYRVSLIPLGGYVRMAGDESDDSRTGDPREFLSRPRWQRFLVFVAGPAMNVALALVVTWVVLWAYGREEVKRFETYPVVAAMTEGSTSEAAGVRVGDRVISVAGRDARDPEAIDDEIIFHPNVFKPLIVERDGERIQLSLNTGADAKYRLGWVGWQLLQDTSEPPLIEAVVPDSPAEAAGLQVGDRIVGVDDLGSVRELEVRAILATSADREVRLTLDRDGETVSLTVIPREQDGRSVIGVLFRRAGQVHREFTALTAMTESVSLNLRMTTAVYKAIKGLVTVQISPRALSGPIEIARVSREAVRSLQTFLAFLGFLSLQLGILNLLPIPVLDGGHILILGLEGVLRRDLSMRVKEIVMQVGLVFLLVLFAAVIWLDVAKATS